MYVFSNPALCNVCLIYNCLSANTHKHKKCVDISECLDISECMCGGGVDVRVLNVNLCVL